MCCHALCSVQSDVDELPRLNVRYNPKNAKGPEAPLDPNHNIFLLVDNGTRHKFGVEIAFRAAFEKVGKWCHFFSFLCMHTQRCTNTLTHMHVK